MGNNLLQASDTELWRQTRTRGLQTKARCKFLVEERVIFYPNLFYRYENMKLNAYLRSF